MLLNITIATFMILLTTAIHTGGMILALKALRSHGGHFKQKLQQLHICWVGGIVLLMVLVSLVEVLVWAVTYLALNAIQGFERALYFSMVTYTTLGFGDIVLDERWRLLTSIQAANGLIMFGWTTAIVIATVQHIFFSEESLKEKLQDKQT